MTERQRVRALGLKTYEGKPCKRGHGATRYTSSSRCVTCTKADARASIRVWSWKTRDQDRKAAYARTHQVKQSGVVVIGESRDFIPFYTEARRLTKETGIPHEVDHIIPLAKGGPHAPWNLEVLTREENKRKGTGYFIPDISSQTTTDA